MIVLDATIVNVALPSIQDDLGFTQSSLAWVVNAYLIAFGGLLLLAGRLGDLIGQRRIFLYRDHALHRRLGCLRPLVQRRGADRGAVRAGHRRRDVERGRAGDDRDDVPRAARSGEGDRRLRLRRVGRQLDRAARRRDPHPGDLLALDLLHQRAGRALPPRSSPAAWSRTSPASASARAPTSSGAAVLTVGVMVGVYAILGVTEHGWLASQTLGLLVVSVACSSAASSSARRGSRTR